MAKPLKESTYKLKNMVEHFTDAQKATLTKIVLEMSDAMLDSLNACAELNKAAIKEVNIAVPDICETAIFHLIACLLESISKNYNMDKKEVAEFFCRNFNFFIENWKTLHI